MTGQLERDSARRGTVWTPERAAEHVWAAYGREVEAVLATGRALFEAKARLPHGKWAEAVALLPFGERMAEHYMRVAGHGLVANPKRVSHLPSAVGTLAVLAQLSGDELDEAIAAGTVSPGMTREDAKALVRALDPHKDAKAALAAPRRKPEPVTIKSPVSAGDSTCGPGATSGEKPVTNVTELPDPEPEEDPAGQAEETVTEETGTVEPEPDRPEPDPEPPRECPGCRSKDEYIADLEARIEALTAKCGSCQAPGAALAWASRPDGARVSGRLCDGCLARFGAEHPERCYSREEHLPATTEADAEIVYAPSGAWDTLL